MGRQVFPLPCVYLTLVTMGYIAALHVLVAYWEACVLVRPLTLVVRAEA